MNDALNENSASPSKARQWGALGWHAFAFGWLVYLVVCLPNDPNQTHHPTGTYLWFTIVPTMISVIVVGVLVCLPSASRKVATVPFAVAWVVFLFLYLPYPNTSRTPAGVFLWFKIVTTMISLIAVGILVSVPRGWAKFATILLAGVLVWIQTIAWIALP
jgi:hypothetical protein